MKDFFNARDVLKVGDKEYMIYRLDALEKAGLTDLKKLPYSIRIVLEALAVMTGREIMTGGSGVTGTAAGTALLALGRDAKIESGSRKATVSPDPRLAAYIAEWRNLADG